MNLSVNYPSLVMLVFLGVCGGLAIFPYSMALRPDLSISMKMIVLSVFQSFIMLTFAVWVGLKAAGALELKLFSPPGRLWIALLSGLSVGVLILLLDKFAFTPFLPDAFSQTSAQIPLWKRFLACFYGGITEELIMRWFLLSGLFWLLSLRWLSGTGLPAAAAFWTANILAALFFGLGHLPATAAIAKLSPLIVLRALVLNGAGGVVFGLIFWKFGLIAAMISHFCADIVLHVVSSFFQN